MDGAVRALVGGGPLPVAEARSLVTASNWALGCDRDILDDRFKFLAFFLLSALCQDVAEKHLCAYHSWFFGTAAT